MPQRAVYKTTNAEYLDNAYDNTPAIEAALARLDEAASLVAVAQNLDGSALPRGSANDFVEFMSAKGEDTFESVVRHGYRVAMQRAVEMDLPVETFWVTAAGSDFEIHVCEGKYAVTVFMFIPDEHARSYGSHRALSKSWVIRAGDREDIRSEAPRRTLQDTVMEIQVSGLTTPPPESQSAP